MQSDAKVPDPAPRGITVPAGTAVVLVLTGAIWGVGLFLLGRHTATPIVTLDPVGASYLASLNRIDQALVKGDEAEITNLIAIAVLPDDRLGHTALELRRARVTELALERKARQVEEEAKRAAAAPEAVLKRLQANLWHLIGGTERTGKQAFPPIKPIDVPFEATTVGASDPFAVPAPQSPPVVSPDLPKPELGELVLAGERFVPTAQIAHPTLPQRAYALHPTKGLLRSDDGGTTWRVGLQPLKDLISSGLLSFTTGDRPLLFVTGGKGGFWLFNDTEDAFFP